MNVVFCHEMWRFVGVSSQRDEGVKLFRYCQRKRLSGLPKQRVRWDCNEMGGKGSG